MRVCLQPWLLRAGDVPRSVHWPGLIKIRTPAQSSEFSESLTSNGTRYRGQPAHNQPKNAHKKARKVKFVSLVPAILLSLKSREEKAETERPNLNEREHN